MTEPYLIAHKVRGEAAFDIAERMRCPECAREINVGIGKPVMMQSRAIGCEECDDKGYWWIVSTSGHRARPYWSIALENVDFQNSEHPRVHLAECPKDWPDHFSINDRPLRSLADKEAKGKSLLAQLGLAKPKLSIVRRF